MGDGWWVMGVGCWLIQLYSKSDRHGDAHLGVVGSCAVSFHVKAQSDVTKARESVVDAHTLIIRLFKRLWLETLMTVEIIADAHCY